MRDKKHLPRLAFVGPLLGASPGSPSTQGEMVARHLERDQYPVIQASNHPNRYIRLLDILRTLFSYCNWIEIQIIQVYSGRSFIVADLASLVAKLCGHKCVFVLHGGNLPSFAGRNTRWISMVLQRADIIITPSRYLSRELSWLGFQILLIPNVIDLPEYPYNERKKVKPNLLWMRTFHPLYNPAMAVEVFGRINKKWPDATLTMAGNDKGLLGKTKLLAERLGLEQKIIFPGFLNATGKKREFSKHDIFVNTNRIDNMPVSLIEAAAFGLPIVTTAVGGISDLLEDGATGLFVEDGDVFGMVECIHQIIERPELASALSRNGRRLAETFSWPIIKSRWEQLFEDLLN